MDQTARHYLEDQRESVYAYPVLRKPFKRSALNWSTASLATFGIWFSGITVFAQQPSAIGTGVMGNSPLAVRLGDSTFPDSFPISWRGMQENRREREAEEREREDEEPEEIETDRDSFTPSTNVVSRGRLVAETSYSFLDNRIGPETHSFPELLFRYGWNDRMELRLGWNYEIGGVNSILTGNVLGHQPIESEEGSRLLYGIKRFLTEQDGWRPTSSIIIQGSTPTHGESNLTFLSVTPVAGWKFHNEVVWDFAMRFSTSGELDDRFNIWSPSTVIKVPFGKRAKAHIEYFGIFTDGRAEETVQHFFSPGVHYLLTPDLEIGWRVGWGLNDQSPNFFANFGIGRQF
jgi:hypothetical protein